MGGKPFLKTLWRIIVRDRMALAGAVILALLVVVALCAPYIATHDPNEINYRVEGVAVMRANEQWRPATVVGEQTLHGVAVTDDGRAVAVGEAGAAVVYDGVHWQSLPTPVETALRAVAVADGLAVAVGDGGAIVHLEGGVGGSHWQVMHSPTEADLLSVSLAAPDLGLAVGRGGTVLRWDGKAWEAFVSGVREDLYSVSLLEDGFGFIVGARSTVLAFDGERLARQNVLGFRNFYGVHALDRETAVAVGERGTIYRYNGRTWSQMFGSETRDLTDVRLLGPSSAWAIGTHGVVMELDGGQWRRVDVGYRRGLHGLDAAGGAIVAVGTDPYVNELSPPTKDHWFGTTHLGRDIFSQTVYGSRTALLVGTLAAVMVTLIGANVGLIAGYFRGRLDNILMRIVDVMYALPFEPFAMVLVMIFRPSLAIVILAVGLLTWRSTARIIRSQVLSLANRPFVKAARVAGASDARILYVHIAPNVLPLALLQLAVSMAFAITAEATLSFLGLGPPQTFSWGTILHAARLSGAWRVAWWWVIPPGVLIMLTVVSVFFISRALEVLTNPRLEGGESDAA